MKELRRWSEDGATREELRVLASARNMRPNAASRARMAAALGASASVLAAASASGATSASVSLFAKIAGIVMTVGVAAGIGWHLTHPATPPSTPAAQVSALEAKTSDTLAAPSASADEGQAFPSESAPPASDPSAAANSDDKKATDHRAEPTVQAHPAPTASASAGLSEEVATLVRAQKALSSQSPEDALRALADYKKRFPKGQLGSEETALRVQALLARGENAKAVALADQFAAAHPENPLAHRLQDLVRNVRGKP